MSPTEPATGCLTPQGLARFLRGEGVTEEDIVPTGDLFDLDYRTGIGISPDRLVAEDSQIFGRGFLALKEGVFLYAEVELLTTFTHLTRLSWMTSGRSLWAAKGGT